jgi:hypothetical protein
MIAKLRAGRAIKEVTQNVDGAALKPRVQLDAANEIESQPPGMSRRRVVPFHAVVVGDRKRAQTPPLGQFHEFFGRELAV